MRRARHPKFQRLAMFTRRSSKVHRTTVSLSIPSNRPPDNLGAGLLTLQLSPATVRVVIGIEAEVGVRVVSAGACIDDLSLRLTRRENAGTGPNATGTFELAASPCPRSPKSETPFEESCKPTRGSAAPRPSQSDRGAMVQISSFADVTCPEPQAARLLKSCVWRVGGDMNVGGAVERRCLESVDEEGEEHSFKEFKCTVTVAVAGVCPLES